MQQKRGLGRGLESLFSENAGDDLTTAELRITEIEPNRGQPRKEFDEEALKELSDSISQHGVLQPLVVRPLASGGYQLVAGERRWRASRMAGLETIPAVIREMTDSQVMEIALVENLQREDLSPTEEAEGYRSLMETYHLTQEETAAKVGKSRVAVANALRLLNLPEKILKLLSSGRISAGHGRALLMFEDAGEQERACQLAESGYSVREIERMAKQSAANKKSRGNLLPKEKDSFYKELELAMNDELGRRVNIYKSKGKGIIEIEFFDREDLIDISYRLAGTKRDS